MIFVIIGFFVILFILATPILIQMKERFKLQSTVEKVSNKLRPEWTSQQLAVADFSKDEVDREKIISLLNKGHSLESAEYALRINGWSKQRFNRAKTMYEEKQNA